MNLSLDLNLKEYVTTMNVLERETISSSLEGGYIEYLTNKYDMNKITVIKDGIVDSNYIRVVSHDKYD